MAISVSESGGAVRFSVRVQPRASHSEIVGEIGGALKVRLTEPPVDDRANEALCRLLAARLKVPRAAVRITGGEHNRTKRIEVSGATCAQVRALAG
jgi:uncharacterized protein